MFVARRSLTRFGVNIQEACCGTGNVTRRRLRSCYTASVHLLQFGVVNVMVTGREDTDKKELANINRLSNRRVRLHYKIPPL
jgi:hypothetical protein